MTAFVTLAGQHMEYGDHMDGGWEWGMFVMMLLVGLAVIALVIWLVLTKHVTRTDAPTTSTTETPIQILDRRLANGEITPEEHKERAEILGGR